MKKTLAMAAALAASLLCASAVSAATMDFTSGSNPFTSAGVTASVSGERNCGGWKAADLTQDGTGLGVKAIPTGAFGLGDCLSGFDEPSFDGQIAERMTFSFNRNVRLKAINFSHYDDNDPYRVFLDAGAGLFEITAGDAFSNPFLFPAGSFGDTLQLLVSDADSAFRVSSIEFTAVPLPAGGLLLLSGLGGIAALRRRRKA